MTVLVLILDLLDYRVKPICFSIGYERPPDIVSPHGVIRYGNVITQEFNVGA